MSGNFIYGYCRQYSCTMSTEFCEKYRRQPSNVAFEHSGRNNLKCAGCGGLTMDTTENNAIKTNAAAPAADQRPTFQDRLRSLMATKPATYREVAEAVGLSQMSVRAWMGGDTIPTVNQAQLLDDFFGTNLVDEYNDLLRKAHGYKGVKINRAAEPALAMPKKNADAPLAAAYKKDKQIEASQSKPADQRPSLKNWLAVMMANKPAGVKEVAEAAGLSIHTVHAWLKGDRFPTVAQATLLDVFFDSPRLGPALTEEYQDLLRPDKATAKTDTAELKSDKKTGQPKSFVDVLKGVASLEKKMTDAAKQAHAEVYGDSETVPVDVDREGRQMAMVILFKVLDCLSLLFKDMGETNQAEDY